jgi:hypothetical protein
MLVEVSATYAGGYGQADAPVDDALLLGAIVAGPDGDWFFELVGPAATVSANRPQFEALVGSLEWGAWL